jgi:hypothetical protein
VKPFSQLETMKKSDVIVRLELRKYYWLLIKSYAHDARGQILLVGDRPGPSAPKEQYYHHTPFYSTKHCSGWLNMLLEEENIPEKKLVWINSADENGKHYPISLATSMKPKKIIALGGKAADWLKKNGVKDFIKVPHPQFWRRFKSKEPYVLIELLKN